ncbi:MAG: hypothetical protein ACXWJM_10040 [Ramlibacter sp.]
MDEPTHRNESEFWDQVAEWLLELPQQPQGQQSERSAPLFPPGTPDRKGR